MKNSKLKRNYKKLDKKDVNIFDILNTFVVIAMYIIMYILIVIFLPKLLSFFFPVVLGLIIATISNKLVNHLENRFNVPRNRTSIVIVFLITLILFFLIFLLGYFVYSQSTKYVGEVHEIIKEINMFIKNIENIINSFMASFPFATSFKNIEIPLIASDNIISILNSISKPIVNFFVDIVKYIPIIIANIIFTIVFAYMFIIDNNKVRNYMKKVFSDKIYDYFIFAKEKLFMIINGWLKTQLIVAFIIFIVLAIGLSIMGVKHFILMSVLIAVVDALPLFGSGFIIWPWMLIEIIQQNYKNFIILVIVYVAIQFIRNIIQNKIMSDEMGLNSFLTVLFLFLGFKFYGLLGLIFAIPIGMFLVSLYEFGIFDNLIYSIKKFFYLLKIFIKQI